MLKIFFACLFLSFLLTGCYTQHRQDIMSKALETTVVGPVEPNLWDFGRVERGEILKHTFIFKNESGKTIKIKDVNTSCGCTASEVKKKTLLPQEETPIEVSFNSQGYSGPVQQQVYVNTDDLDNPVVKYIIKAEVVK